MNDATFEVRSEAPPVTLVGVRGVAGRMDAEFFRPVFVRNEAKLRSGRFSVARLGDLILKGNYGSLPDSGDYSNSGVPLIRGTDLRSMLVTLEAAVRVPETYLDKFKKAQVQPGDLLMLAKGASLDRPDSVAMYPLDGPTALANGSIFVMRPDRKRVNPFFLLGYLASNALLLQKRRASTNTGALYNDIGSISGFLVPLPDRRIQDFIGAKVELAERCRALASREHDKLAADLEALYQGCPHDAAASLSTMVRPAEMDGSRLDAWYHQRHFITLTDWLRRNPAFVELGKVAGLSSDRWSPVAHGQSTFRYIEISNVDPSTGHVSHSEVPLENAPSRARKLVRRFDVLASTVRPNRGAVGLVPDSLDGAVATTGFAVVRPASKTDGFFLLAVLRHPASTAQLMRCNTGSAYPAIEESVLPQIWIPGAKPETRKSLGARELKRTTLLQTAVDLVDQAKADVEALIEGTLDVQAILSGTLKAPSADDIPELAEDGA